MGCIVIHIYVKHKKSHIKINRWPCAYRLAENIVKVTFYLFFNSKLRKVTLFQQRKEPSGPKEQKSEDSTDPERASAEEQELQTVG